ncbi:hypothetical protein PG985_014292 [Apiospora marii]|uniref:uncharacterized protein n=1 Tax=Apiospora marii TaxID=335849 RepID=UPI00312FD158
MVQHDIELQQRLSSPGMYGPSADMFDGRGDISQPDPSHSTHGSSQYHRISQVTEDDSRSVRPLLYNQGTSYTNQDTDYASSYGQSFHKPDAIITGRPKKVLETSWLRFFKTWPVHLLAIGSTVGITYVGSRHLFWYPEEGPVVLGQQLTHDITSNLLQLVTKVHEILIVFSFSAMALAMFRRRLVGDGVRLGFLTGGYRVGDLMYLTSSSFWRQGLDQERPWEVLLCGYLVFATLMSTVVGPVSAVLLIPALDWYPYAPGAAFSNISPPIIYRLDRDLVWPSVMKAEGDSMKIDRCVWGYGIYMSLCPGTGFREVNEWVKDWAATDLNNSLAFQSTTADISRRLRLTQAAEKSSVVLSTTPSEFLMHSIGLFQNYIRDGDVGEISGEGKPRYKLTTKGRNDSADLSSAQLFQPLVQSKCKMYDKAIFKDSKKVFYPTEDLNCMGDEDCRRRQESPRELIPNETIFQDEKGEGGNDIITDYFVAEHNSSSSVVYLAGQFPQSAVGRPHHNVYLCNLVASWIPADFHINQTESDELVSTQSSDERMRDAFRQTPAQSRVVGFEDSWLRLLNPLLVNMTETKHEWYALQALTKHFSTKDRQEDYEAYQTSASRGDADEDAEAFLAKVFGVYLTEALARVSMARRTLVTLHRNETVLSYADLNYQHHPVLGVNNITKVDETHVFDDRTNKTKEKTLDDVEKGLVNSNLPIVLEAERYGYGTGKERKTLRFAQAIMGIYLGTMALYALAVAVGHLLELGRVRGRSGGPIRAVSVAAWSDLQDLVMLALKTPAPAADDDDDLADAGAGVTSADTWKKVVQTRADEMNRVQLVLRDRAEAPRLNRVGKGLYY